MSAPWRTHCTGNLLLILVILFACFQAPAAAAAGEPIAEAGGPYSGEVGETIGFIGTGSTDPGGYIGYAYWDFGDGSPGSPFLNANHVYTNSGTYVATLFVKDDDNLTDTDTAEVSIVIGNQAPTADPGGPYLATTATPLRFDGSDSYDPDGRIVSYAWDFGDGGMSSGETPDHTYTIAGTYTVNLEVEDEDGATDIASTTVEVSEANYPPSADAGGPYAGDVGIPVPFFGGASDPNGAGDVVFFEWNFGDGNMATGINVYHTYELAGTYNVTLTVQDSQGETSLPDTTSATIGVAEQPPVADAGEPYSGTTALAVTFDASGSFDPDGDIVSYAWDFGDGNSGSGVAPTNTYSTAGRFDVLLVVEDNDGLTDTNATYAVIDTANQAPIADAGGPYTGTVAVAVSFFGSAQDENVGTVTGEWNFGDGSAPVAGITAAHTYSSEGLYWATFTVEDEFNLKGSDSTLVLIGQGPQIPVAQAGGPYRGKAGTSIFFDGTASDDLDGDIVSYAWDFGDGATASGPTPIHTYATAGVYRVSLTVIDNDTLASTDDTLSLIIDPNEPPVAIINGPSSGLVGEELIFDGAQSYDPDGSISYVIWNFGEGSFDSGLTTSHKYQVGGTSYPLTMIVVDNENATGADTNNISITAVKLYILDIADSSEVGVFWVPITPPQWVLQKSTNLSDWVDSPSGNNNPVILPTDDTEAFYRVTAP